MIPALSHYALKISCCLFLLVRLLEWLTICVYLDDYIVSKTLLKPTPDCRLLSSSPQETHHQKNALGRNNYTPDDKRRQLIQHWKQGLLCSDLEPGRRPKLQRWNFHFQRTFRIHDRFALGIEITQTTAAIITNHTICQTSPWVKLLLREEREQTPCLQIAGRCWERNNRPGEPNTGKRWPREAWNKLKNNNNRHI